MPKFKVVIILICVGALVCCGKAQAEEQYWRIQEGRSVLLLDQKALDAAGLSVRTSDGRALDGHNGVTLEPAPESPLVSVSKDLTTGEFTGLQVFHSSGLDFSTADATYRMNAVLLDGSSYVGGLDAQSDQAPRLLVGGGDRFMDAPTKTLVISDAPVMISPALASALGRATWASLSIGTVSMQLTFADADGVPPTESHDRVCPNPRTGPDVIVGALEATSPPTPIANYNALGTIDAFAVATYSCNMGNVNLSWSANSVNHPVIGQAVYRFKTVDGSGRFEQIGLGWLKHGFTALTDNLCCTCNGQGGSVLGQGCADPYTAARNGTQLTTSGGLGPRFQVNPHTGAFTWPYMFRNTAIPGGETSISRRVQVQFDDLNAALNPGAQYFIEGQYVTPDDAAAGNQDNNASYAPCTFTDAGGSARYNGTAALNVTVRETSAIQAWRTLETGVNENTVNVPEDSGTPTGKLILAAKATNLGGGVYHYEYALYNMNSDRAVRSFSVPVSPYANITNIGFHDVFYHSFDGCGSSGSTPITFDGTDWPATVAGGSITWNMVSLTGTGANAPCNSNALRWGTTYNFRFDVNLADTSGNASIGQWKVANVVSAPTVVPMAITCLKGDVNGDGFVDGLDVALFTQLLVGGGGTVQQRCAGDCQAIPSGAIDMADVDPFADCLLAGGC